MSLRCRRSRYDEPGIWTDGNGQHRNEHRDADKGLVAAGVRPEKDAKNNDRTGKSREIVIDKTKWVRRRELKVK